MASTPWGLDPEYAHAFQFMRFPLDEPFTASVEGRVGVLRGTDPAPPKPKKTLPEKAADVALDVTTRTVPGGSLITLFRNRDPEGAGMVATVAVAAAGVGLLLVGVAALVFSGKKAIASAVLPLPTAGK